MPSKFPLLASTAIAASLLAATAAAQAPADIGVTASAVNQVKGAIGTQDRSLKIGDRVFQREVISTGDNSKAQLVFRDETSLTVGPTSSVTLDSFVYDPARATSTSTVNTARGVFRFVSGNMPSQSYSVRTPAGTIGVRGTVFELFVGIAGTITLFVTDGSVLFQMRDGRTIVVPAGSVLEIGADGVPRLNTSLSAEQYRRLSPVRAFVQRRDGIGYLLTDQEVTRNVRRSLRGFGSQPDRGGGDTGGGDGGGT